MRRNVAEVEVMKLIKFGGKRQNVAKRGGLGRMEENHDFVVKELIKKNEIILPVFILSLY